MLEQFDAAIDGLAGDRSDHVRQAMMEYAGRVQSQLSQKQSDLSRVAENDYQDCSV